MRECEVRVLDVNVDETQAKLIALGAKKVFEKTFNRIILDFPDKRLEKQKSWIRLRTDGTKHAITLKQTINTEIDGTEEIEINVSNFDETLTLLKQLGLQDLYYQENRRTRFAYQDITFDIDSWPMIPTYLEIEAKSKEEVLRGLKLLGFEESQATTLHGKDIYKKYGIDIHSLKEVKFEKKE